MSIFVREEMEDVPCENGEVDVYFSVPFEGVGDVSFEVVWIPVEPFYVGRLRVAFRE
jgi:hypothetical protein